MAGPAVHRARRAGRERNFAVPAGVVFSVGAEASGGVMRRILIAATLAVAALGAATDLESARDRQDRPALEKLAAESAAAEQKSTNDAAAHYRAALAYSYLAEVAQELRDKGGVKRA